MSKVLGRWSGTTSCMNRKRRAGGGGGINENFPAGMENVYGILQVIMQEPTPGPATYDSLMGIPKWFLALRFGVYAFSADARADKLSIESFLVN
jgi:hypothetical protein